MIHETNCFIALGGNRKRTFDVMQKALLQLSKIKGVSDLTISRLYETSPVSSIPQDNFLNMAASFTTSLPLLPLFDKLETLERKLGKKKKSKEEPRLIDIDLLFYGNLKFDNDTLKVPHPFWDQRLFVLIPLLDLTEYHPCDKSIDLRKIIDTLSNNNNERVTLYEKNKS